MKKINFLLLIFFVIIYQIAFSQNGTTLHSLPTGYTNTQLRWKNCIASDNSGNIYIGFIFIGIGKYNIASASWSIFDTLNSGLPDNNIRALEFDALGNMWVGTIKGLAKFDGNNWQVYDSLNSGLVTNNISSLKTTSAGLWCGTSTGLHFFDGISWTLFNSTNSGLVNDTVLCMDADNMNNIYIGTQGGLSHFNGSIWSNYTKYNSALAVNKITNVKCTSANTVWLFNTSLYRLANGTILDDRCQYKTPDEDSYFKGILGLAVDTNDRAWFFKNAFTLVRMDPVGNIEYINDSLWASLISGPFGAYFTIDDTGVLWCAGGPIPLAGYLFSFDENVSTGFTSFDKNQNSWQRYLDINNVSALISNRGSMFWDMNQSAGISKYEEPKCSGKTSTFTSGLWIGGFDQTGVLHISAQTYNQVNAFDYNTGPLDTTNATTTSAVNAAYSNIWKIDRNTIDDFKANFLNGNVTNGSYPVPSELLSYPAIGAGNYTRNMSPYIDYDNDGNYNPYDGDYPLIKGDQQLYWIFNDMDTINRETQGIPLGVEVRAYAYAYTCDQYVLGDSNAVLDYTTFYRYEITNRSNNTYDSTFIGLFNDFDLGDAADDYIGCDTVLNTGFCYNADNFDGTIVGYENNPPMFNCQLLQGPEPVLNDGIDNNHDGVTDEAGELNMMSSFNTYIGDFANNGNPETPLHYYYYLTSRFKDGTHLTYGTSGGQGGTVPTDYLYSGIPYSSTGWTEISMSNPGADKRGIICSGPFHLAPGETKSIDFAYVFTWDSTAANGLTTSIARNTADLQRVKYWFDNNNYPSCLNTSIQNIEVKNTDVTIFPNPADDYLNVVYSGATKARLEIYDITGRYISSKEIRSRDKINVRSLSSGLYVVKVKIGDVVVSKKFIKR